ncbi:hypothetical protein BKA93DRAFT_762530 [Sparassis latifolia]
MPQVQASSDGGKVKQTRRRQRLSCVECTKRRQKCDRQIPCGLCTTRGIAHLCRWEPIVVRPTPQRPPVMPSSAASDTIQALSTRIAVLEQTLLRQNIQLSTGYDCNSPGNSTFDQQPSSLDKPEVPIPTGTGAAGGNADSEGPRALYDFNVQVAAVALAQLSLAPREEYIGAGTILCALHKLGEPETWRFPYSRSSSMTSPVSLSHSCGVHPFSAPMRGLLSGLPPRGHVDELLDAYFEGRNWEFGLPENWFRGACQKMWRHLEVRCPGPRCLAPGACMACAEEINPHWLVLLFAVLALSPRNRANDGASFCSSALAARRLVEDILLAVPAYSMSESSVHGAVFTCIGTALLAAYHADRGRVSEAWKLAGIGMRSAQAMGLHRDPGWRKWETMGKEESELRLLGWWSLWISDRIYSFILGRPMMAHKGSFDVTLLPGPVHSDGFPNPNAPYLQAFIQLCEIIGEGADKCLGIQAPSYATVLEFDHRFRTWLAQLPAELQWHNLKQNSPSPFEHEPVRSPRCLSIAERSLNYQRHTLAAYYLGGLMNIHRPYLMHPPPILPPPAGLARSSMQLNPSRERCIELAQELVHTLCAAHAATPEWASSAPAMIFQYSYFVFDGAVALAGALSQTPPHPRAEECLDLMDRALRMLEACVAAAEGMYDGEGEIAKRAITVLEALRKAGGWGRAEQHPCSGESGGDYGSPEHSHQHSPGGESVAESSSSDPSSVHSLSSSYYHSPTSSYPPNLPAGPAQPQPQPTSIPYLTTPMHGFAPHPVMQVPTHVQVQPSMGLPSLYAETYSPPLFGTGGGAGLGLGPGPKASAQTMMMPFEMLQGSGEFDVEWVRLAGMENWQNGGAGFLPPNT